MNESQTAILEDLESRLVKAGIRDIKFFKDDKKWNELTTSERLAEIQLLVNTMLAGDYTPAPKLSNSPITLSPVTECGWGRKSGEMYVYAVGKKGRSAFS